MAEYTKIETAMEIICCLCKDLYPDEDCPGECDWMGYLKENAADVAPVLHGRFVHDGQLYVGGLDWFHCSSCGRLVAGAEERFDYCPWCGAKMDGGDNNG